jgi:hypothetical protein
MSFNIGARCSAKCAVGGDGVVGGGLAFEKGLLVMYYKLTLSMDPLRWS